MDSPVAAYPNSHVLPSTKTLFSFLVETLAVPSQIRSIAIQAALDGVVLAAILLVLFMVPA